MLKQCHCRANDLEFLSKQLTVATGSEISTAPATENLIDSIAVALNKFVAWPEIQKSEQTAATVLPYSTTGKGVVKKQKTGPTEIAAP